MYFTLLFVAEKKEKKRYILGNDIMTKINKIDKEYESLKSDSKRFKDSFLERIQKPPMHLKKK